MMAAPRPLHARRKIVLLAGDRRQKGKGRRLVLGPAKTMRRARGRESVSTLSRWRFRLFAGIFDGLVVAVIGWADPVPLWHRSRAVSDGWVVVLMASLGPRPSRDQSCFLDQVRARGTCDHNNALRGVCVIRRSGGGSWWWGPFSFPPWSSRP